MEDGLPSYGAQHRQDALWEGGNEALPPGWQEYDNGHHEIYQDGNVFLVSSKRPLPGVRLDYYPGQLLVPGCEWHISPLGRSYFVNHNNRTTSWKKPIPERPPESLIPKYIIKGHSKCIWSMACVGKSRSVISASSDGSIRQWTRDGKTIGQPWRSDGGAVGSIAVSPDETMVVSGSVDGRIRLWDIKDGRTVGEPWEGHSNAVRCLDWSPNGQEIASGSEDGTLRRWNRTGQQIAPPIEVEGWWNTVKYSPQSDKFAACGPDDIIRVWSKNGELLIEISEPDGYWVHSLCWSMDGTCIFSGSGDGTIRKWRLIDGKELVVLRGHTKPVISLCLTLDESHLLSASHDCSVRIWNLRTNNPVSEPLWHDDEVRTVSMSPDRQYIASGGLDTRIYLWDFEAALKQSSNHSAHGNKPQSNAKLEERTPSSRDILDVSTISQPRVHNPNSSKYGDNFWGIDPGPHRSEGGSAPPGGPFPSRRHLFHFLRFNPRPADSSTQMTQQRRHWNVSLPLRPPFLPWARPGFFNQPQRHDDGDMELQAHPPVVDVPLANGLLRVANADGVRRAKEKEKKRKEELEEEEEEEEEEGGKGKGKQANIVQNAKNAATTSQRRTQNNITRQSAGPSQASPSSELQAVVLTSPTMRAAGATPLATSSTPHTDAVTLRTGCCTPFFICIGCGLVQHSDGHH